jgi:glutamate 5-kinase
MTAPLSLARRIVVKLGSALIAATDGANIARLAEIAADIAALKARGVETVIVSSGAVALGRGALKLGARKLSLAEKQAAAAAGQPLLMQAWSHAFAAHGVAVAQALLTPDDTERRRRWLNGRATLESLLALNAVPIINENDTVATQELRYGDNDRLAARTAQMVGADVLVLLSDIDGLYTADPRIDPNAEHLALVDAITPRIEAMAGGANAAAGLGSGGMATKIEAARIATLAGCWAAVARGDIAHPLAALASGGKATWFKPIAEPRAAYKAWIAGAISPAGALVLDAGAVTAVRAGKSLLPAGITRVDGAFDRGDTVRVIDPGGTVIARGVARYDSQESARIAGKRSSDIEATLGYDYGAVIIHADDLVVG